MVRRREHKLPGALDGIRVIEWATMVNGPSAGVMLGELGAEVIKLEDRIYGDGSRGAQGWFGTRLNLPHGLTVPFELNNRNKKGITVDLKKEKGKEILHRLVKNSDVFLTNYSYSRARRLGADYEALSKLNSRLIYAATSGYGPKGPDSEKRAFDWVGQARSGMMASIGERDAPPGVMVGAVTDQLASMMLAYGIMVALFARERLNIGQEVATSMTGAAIYMQSPNFGAFLLRGREMGRHSREEAKYPFSNTYRCSDNKWIVLTDPQVDRFWHQVCQTLGLEELEHDPRFDNVETRKDNAKELVSRLEAIFATKTRDEWARILEEGAGIACSPVLSIPEVAADPQVLENEYIIEFEHPVLGRVKFPGSPVSFSKTPARTRSAAPTFGQHTEDVLLNSGYTWDEIADLKKQEVI